MQSQEKLVSIIVLNWNGMRYLSDCIGSVHQQTYQSVEVIVVDNGSTDDSICLLENNYPGIRLVANSENLGFAQGMNIGIEVSQGEFVLLLNEDCYLDPEFISNGIKEFRADPLLAWVGGLVYEWKDGERTNTIINAAFALKRRFQSTTLPDTTSRQEALMASSCAMLLRRLALDDVILDTSNWLDRRYFAYWEDIDLALRLWLRGWKCLFTPDMHVWHAISGAVGGKRRLVDKPPVFQRIALRNRYFTIIKNVPTIAFINLLPSLLLAELLILPYFALTSPRTAVCSIEAIWDVLKSLPEVMEQRRLIQSSCVISHERFLSFFHGF